MNYNIGGTNYINATPHALNFHGEEGELILAPSGFVPRVQLDEVEPGVFRVGEVVGLPDDLPEDTRVIVSLPTAIQLAGDGRFCAIGGEIRNEAGHTVGFRSFKRIIK